MPSNGKNCGSANDSGERIIQVKGTEPPCPKVLVVDDDEHILEVLEARLTASGLSVITTKDALEALEALKREPIHLVISDVRMPKMGGMDLLREILTRWPSVPVILLTAYGTIPDAVEAMKMGAVDYLTKPFDGRELVKKIKDLIPFYYVQHDSQYSPDQMEDLSSVFWGGRSKATLELFSLIKRVIPTDVNVLIVGESGVGKELVARLIHQRGPRRDQPFVVVDCGATPAGLLESELFGHRKGAFTHAIVDKMGLIEAADKGTLFLDEVGNVSAEMQARLLRFLEDRKIRRIGDIKEISVDCRVMAATNADLSRLVEEGKFREDLYYRLRVVTIRVPPLRERREDIPLLAQRFVERFCEAHGLATVKIPKQTMEWLCEQNWPGNVRELRNALEAALVLCDRNVLMPRDLLRAGLLERPKTLQQQTHGLSLQDSERYLIERALERSGWVQKEAAKLLGISPRALHYRMRKLGIQPTRSMKV